ncbi:MAG: pyrroline-5-carboxylate reductase [Deltaproteobacteria bacterium]|nr:pyrroline-5-carboxylate reductase [Deltaproteobacteria bacterium]
MNLSSATVAVVGVGGLGGALVRGLQAGGLPPQRLVLCDAVAQKALNAGGEAVSVAADPAEAAAVGDVLVLCVKPPDVAGALDRVATAIRPHAVVISAAAGVTLEKLRQSLGATGALVRAMPNVNVAVRASMTALVADPSEPTEALRAAEWVFGHVGRTVRLPQEKLMDAATSLAASGPAWVAAMLEALMDGGVLAGLPRTVAVDMALSMMEGTAKHLRDAAITPGALKDMVMSPGGTTAAGMLVLEQAGVRGALMATVQAAAERARLLGKG